MKPEEAKKVKKKKLQKITKAKVKHIYTNKGGDQSEHDGHRGKTG